MIRKFLSFLILLITGLHAYAQLSADEVINAERSFAKMAFEQNMQTAFLNYMSDSSVIEQQGKLVKGYPVISKRPADTTGKLLWHPTFAAIASLGDFGYTTGPYSYNIKGRNVAYGNYATVWQKQNDGQWKFVIDLGAGHRDSTTLPNDTIVAVLPDSRLKNNENTDLISIDKMFATQLVNRSQEAYKNVLHPAAHILRQGKNAAVSEKQKQTLFSEPLHISFTPEHYKISSSYDMGVVYGSCETETTKDGKNLKQQGVYMHVWRKDAVRGWQILHETIHL